MKADRFGGDDVHQRAALHSGEHHLVDGRGEFLFAQDHPGPRSAQSLVRGGGHDMGVRHRRRMHAARNQSGEMRHVDQVERAHFVGDLAHAGKINDSRIGAASADDQLGAFFLGQLLQIVVVDGLSFLGHAIGNDAVGLAGKIQMMAVGEMSAMRQIQSENGVAGLQDGGVASMLACDPACGCTLACSAPKSFLARSRARSSTTSANSQPP